MQVQEGTVTENPIQEELSTNMYCESKECPSSFPMEEPGIHEHVRNVADEPTAGSTYASHVPFLHWIPFHFGFLDLLILPLISR